MIQPTRARRVSQRRRRGALLAVAALAAGLAATAWGGALPGASRASRSAALPHAPGSRPNIVFVLTDDLSMNLLRFMPHVRAMERHGMTFRDYFVSDSLCCPSRASIFTGEFPHDTKVFGNFGPNGGFHEFYKRGEERHTFAVALQESGYVTAMMGKYLNGYMERRGHTADGATTDVPRGYVPPGWNEWDVAGWGYPEFGYELNHDGHVRHYGRRPRAYLTDVLARKGVRFIAAAARTGRPFFLELATFAPHYPYTPAPRDVNDFPGLRAPRPPSFDVLPRHAPHWLAGHRRLTRRQIARIDQVFRLRAQAVQAVDRMIGRVERQLRADGLARNTYLVFSSDNGLHTGEHRLMPGKLTAFDTDIRVPLVVVGPGVPPGASTPLIAENIDLAETFAAIGRAPFAGDGQSLLPLLHGAAPPDWRTAILVEHHGPPLSVLDPDFQQSSSGNPTTYEAMRTHGFLYVEYADGEREFYDLLSDPFELDNLAGSLSSVQRAFLHTKLLAIEACHGTAACSAAMRIGRLPGPLPPIRLRLERESPASA